MCIYTYCMDPSKVSYSCLPIALKAKYHDTHWNTLRTRNCINKLWAKSRRSGQKGDHVKLASSSDNDECIQSFAQLISSGFRENLPNCTTHRSEAP